MTRPLQLVWFKRDLRIHDHEALVRAAATGPTLGLYVWEPELLAQPEWDDMHSWFILQSLEELGDRLQRLGGRLEVRVGAMPTVIDELHRRHRIAALHSHEEVGNQRTYARDKRVKRWCREHGVPWHEYVQAGVNRPHRSRDGWAKRWTKTMSRPALAPPDRIESPGGRSERVGPITLGVSKPVRPEAQRGGESAARDLLGSFLSRRGEHYRSDMSSPNTAWQGCSRLSPHLAYGTISSKTCWQATERAIDLYKARRDSTWVKSLEAFGGRLRWRDHFMQKLEDETRVEFENFNRGFDGMRDPARTHPGFEAWRRGETGYPMVDA